MKPTVAVLFGGGQKAGGIAFNEAHGITSANGAQECREMLLAGLYQGDTGQWRGVIGEGRQGQTQCEFCRRIWMGNCARIMRKAAENLEFEGSRPSALMKSERLEALGTLPSATTRWRRGMNIYWLAPTTQVCSLQSAEVDAVDSAVKRTLDRRKTRAAVGGVTSRGRK